MAQHEVVVSQELLNDDGRIAEEGWARQQVWQYDRSRIKAPWFRIKEWDYYCILSQKRGYGIALTVSDLGYAALASLVWLDFTRRSFEPLDSIKLLTRGSIKFPPSSSSGEVKYEDAKVCIRYQTDGGERHIEASSSRFAGGQTLECDLTLQQDLRADTMVIATSWKENRRAFYYNQKINCMPARGMVSIGDKIYAFEPDDSFGVLDWGRGYWLYRNRWYWGSASGLYEGKPIGWNIGYGFTDRTPASENVIFYDGKANKLDEVVFHLNEDNYLEPWKFTSNDGRFEMDFEPILDRHSAMKLGIIASIQNQVFGYYSGTLVLDDGKKISIDRLLGFAEDVRNRW
ncbi:MAG TPA: DUF2804 domain-containing protein [Spirochaetales bacterium]|nr:DUF2804 domain-containing protein [Spirochaetales bacterium]